MKTILILVGLLAAAGCTDSQRANIATLGEAGQVECYSGGVLIYNGTSTVKITTIINSDGWQFVDAKTGEFVRVSGDCVIKN